MRPTWRSGGVQGTEYERCLPELLAEHGLRPAVFESTINLERKARVEEAEEVARAAEYRARAAEDRARCELRKAKIFYARRQEYEAIVRSRERFEVRRAGHATSCRMWRKAPPPFEVPRVIGRAGAIVSGGRTDEAVANAWMDLVQHRRRNGCGHCNYKQIAENYWEVADYKREWMGAKFWEVAACPPELDLSLAATPPECVTCLPDSLYAAAGLPPLGPRKEDPPPQMQHLYCSFGPN
jgi:hypothetical protein